MKDIPFTQLVTNSFSCNMTQDQVINYLRQIFDFNNKAKLNGDTNVVVDYVHNTSDICFIFFMNSFSDNIISRIKRVSLNDDIIYILRHVTQDLNNLLIQSGHIIETLFINESYAVKKKYIIVSDDLCDFFNNENKNIVISLRNYLNKL